jgi:hypothetical protein
VEKITAILLTILLPIAIGACMHYAAGWFGERLKRGR